MLDALADYHRSERYGFSPPGHRQGRGADERALAVLGKDAFRDDVLASGGLDDRMSPGGYLTAAEDLMAEAVGAQTAFFSTCGSSLSVKAAMMAVAADRTAACCWDVTATSRWWRGSSCPVCRIELPSPGELVLDTVVLPRDAFFGATQMVPAEQRAGFPPSRLRRIRLAFPPSYRERN